MYFEQSKQQNSYEQQLRPTENRDEHGQPFMFASNLSTQVHVKFILYILATRKPTAFLRHAVIISVLLISHNSSPCAMEHIQTTRSPQNM